MSRLYPAFLLALFTGGAVLSARSAQEAPPDPVTARDDGPDNAQTITEPAKVELVFVLDTTGSMGEMIQSAKDTIWSIVDQLASQRPQPEIRVGLVAYRDRSDDWTHVSFDLNQDMDQVYQILLGYEAAGGGDGPESVNGALAVAVDEMSWSGEGRVYRAIFLVGDAPPHMDYEGEETFIGVVHRARQKGVVVSAIRCGEDPLTASYFREIAAIGGGTFIDMPRVIQRQSNPADANLARLNAEITATALPYGSEAQQSDWWLRAKSGTTDGAIAARLAFLSRTGGRVSSGGGELLDDLAAGRVRLEELPESQLPMVLRGLSRAEQQAIIQARQLRRAELRAQIDAAIRERDAREKAERERRVANAEPLSFSEEVDGFAIGELRALGYVE